MFPGHPACSGRSCGLAAREERDREGASGGGAQGRRAGLGAGTKGVTRFGCTRRGSAQDGSARPGTLQRAESGPASHPTRPAPRRARPSSAARELGGPTGEWLRQSPLESPPRALTVRVLSNPLPSAASGPPHRRPPIPPLLRARASAPPGDGQTREWRGSPRCQIAGARRRGAALTIPPGAAGEACRCPWPLCRRRGHSFAGAQNPTPGSSPAPPGSALRRTPRLRLPLPAPARPPQAQRPAQRRSPLLPRDGRKTRGSAAGGRACFPAAAAAAPCAAPARPDAALRSAPPALRARRWIYEWGEEATCRRRRLVLTARSPGPPSSGCRDRVGLAPASRSQDLLLLLPPPPLLRSRGGLRTGRGPA